MADGDGHVYCARVLVDRCGVLGGRRGAVAERDLGVLPGVVVVDGDRGAGDGDARCGGGRAELEGFLVFDEVVVDDGDGGGGRGTPLGDGERGGQGVVGGGSGGGASGGSEGDGHAAGLGGIVEFGSDGDGGVGALGGRIRAGAQGQPGWGRCWRDGLECECARDGRAGVFAAGVSSHPHFVFLAVDESGHII